MNNKKSVFTGMMSYLFGVVLKTIIHLYGLRFFKQAMAPNIIKLGVSTLLLDNGAKLTFTFYKQFYHDVVYKRGSVSRQTYVGYVVGCEFDDILPEHLEKYNNLKFTLHRSIFHSWLFDYIEEEAIAHLLMEFYVKFIEHEIRNSGNSTVF